MGGRELEKCGRTCRECSSCLPASPLFPLGDPIIPQPLQVHLAEKVPKGGRPRLVFASWLVFNFSWVCLIFFSFYYLKHFSSMSGLSVEAYFMYFGDGCDARGIIVHVNLGNHNVGSHFRCDLNMQTLNQ